MEASFREVLLADPLGEEGLFLCSEEALRSVSALTVREVAAELRISPSMVRKLIAVDGLPCIRLGSRIIVRRQDLDSWIESRVQVSGKPRGVGPSVARL